MTERTRIHWQAPATVVASLIAGTLFAIGHHLFYQGLDGRVAPNDIHYILGSDVSDQQLNIAGGTALSFLVKACLFAALNAAYAQLFWRVMLHRTPEVTLERLDATFSALTNAHHMFKAKVWWRYPVLFTVALIAWLMPLASVVTPATLSIKSAAQIHPPSRLLRVPNVDFVNLNYLNYMNPISFTYNGPNEALQYFYQGPNKAVVNVAQTVAPAGAVLPLSSPGINSSYTLTFPGPALQCTNISDSLRAVVQNNILKAMRPGNGSCTAYGYLGWTPASNNEQSGLLPEPVPFSLVSNGSYVLNSSPLTNRAGPAPASVYLAAMPNMLLSTYFQYHANNEVCINGSLSSPSLIAHWFANGSMLQCDLHNSTYTVDFSYINGDQQVTVKTVPLQDEVMVTTDWVYGPPPHPVPGTRASGPECSPFSYNNTANCLFHSSVTSTLAYQAILESFNGLLVGSVHIPSNGASTPEADSNIQNTILADTPELSFLNSVLTFQAGTNYNSLQQAVLASNGTLYDGILNNQSTILNKPLTRAMEELFQNITISMMSSKKLQPDYTSAFAPPPANVTFNTYHNIYTYSAWKLWIAYGIAIFLTSIGALLGLITIAADGASYSLGFSTVIRASRSAYSNVELKEEDVQVNDPLPSRLAKAKMWLGSPPDASKGRTSRLSNGAGAETGTTGPSTSLLTPDSAGTVWRTFDYPDSR